MIPQSSEKIAAYGRLFLKETSRLLLDFRSLDILFNQAALRWLMNS